MFCLCSRSVTTMHITHTDNSELANKTARSEDVVNAESAADGQLRKVAAIYKYFACACINNSLFPCYCVFYVLV